MKPSGAGLYRCVVEVAHPLKQGLKQDRKLKDIKEMHVEVAHPLKQGLKRNKP